VKSTAAPVYRVNVLKMGQADVPGPEVYWMSHWGEWERLFFYMLVIQGAGVTAIINTGPPSDLSALNERWRGAGDRCQMIRAEVERPANALASIGVAAGDVTHVLLTPLQVYATANLSLFPNAQFCFSKRGWIEDIMARPGWVHVPRELSISDDMLRYLLFDAWSRVRLLEDEDEIAPGIRAWWAGGHHRSSMVYTVQTSRGVTGAGDCVFKYGNLDGAPLGISESLEEGHRACTRIRAEVDHFIPLYDPEVLKRYPGGVVA
jgi:glyoxylase-like metal-dependent hydrolase (beta-lactamase superfamily II)